VSDEPQERRPAGPDAGESEHGSPAYATDKTGPASNNPNMAAGERSHQVESEIAVALPDHLAAVRDRLTGAFDGLGVLGFRGELTLVVGADQLMEVLAFCRDDPEVACELLTDLSGVHWPAGERVEHAEETTGWPTYTATQAEGIIEVDYILTSVAHNHRFRIRVNVGDHEPHLPTASGLYKSADAMEREAYDFFGVVFDGHPDLKRILNPDEWVGYPLRKDYPLGGVEVQYKGATIPPPDQRGY
jgi:NADH-quinone oxidoreductase subunit C